MAKVAGVDILLLVNTGTDQAPVWTEVGGQRGATLSESLETIDVTAKDSGGVQEFAPGLYSWTISADGVDVVGNEAQEALKTAIRNRQPIKVRWSENGVDVFEGTAIVTSYEVEAPHDDVATFSLELQGTGQPVLNPARDAGDTA